MKRLFFNLKILFVPCQDNDYRPHFLQSKLLVYYLVILLVLKIIFVSFIVYLPKTVFFADVTKSALFNMTNQEREALGLNTLKENPQLAEAAYQKAQDMLANDYFSHQSPAGLSPWHWFQRTNYSYQAAGENLAIGFLDSDEVVRAWINSPSHRANLLSPGFEEMGIAVLTGEFEGQETTVVVQHFGSPLAQVVEAKETTEKIKEAKPQSAEPQPAEPEIEIKQEVEEDVSVKQVAGMGAVEFMAVDYPNLFEEIVLYSLAFIVLALLLDVFIKIKIQDRQLISKTIILIVLLGLFLFANKELIIQIIPHRLMI